MTLSGTTIHPEEVLMLDILSANRDEWVFPHAKEMNFDRETNPMISSCCQENTSSYLTMQKTSGHETLCPRQFREAERYFYEGIIV